MKTLKLYFLLAILTTLCFTSCNKDDDSDDGEEQGTALLTSGACGEFFDGLNLTSLCGVEANNTQPFGSETVCTYVIRQNSTASQELYTSTIYELTSISEAEDFFSVISTDTFDGQTSIGINGVGNEAVFLEDIDSMDFSIVFRLKNVIVVVSTDEELFELGCSDPQARLKELATLVIDKLQ